MITGGTYSVQLSIQLTLVGDDGTETKYTPPVGLYARVWGHDSDSKFGGRQQYVQFNNGVYGWVHEADLEIMLGVE